MASDEAASAKELFCKTVLCKFFSAGRCKKGNKCMFAHGAANKAPMPDFYRTRLCPSFVDTGSCPHGDRCSYAHSTEELRATITKVTSNAGKRELVQKTASNTIKQKACVPHTRESASLQQLLISYGVPEVSEGIDALESLPKQPDALGFEEPVMSPSLVPRAHEYREIAEKLAVEGKDKTHSSVSLTSGRENSEFKLREDITLLLLKNLRDLHIEACPKGNAIEERMIDGIISAGYKRGKFDCEISATQRNAPTHALDSSLCFHDKMKLDACRNAIWTC